MAPVVLINSWCFFLGSIARKIWLLLIIIYLIIIAFYPAGIGTHKSSYYCLLLHPQMNDLYES